MSKGQDMQSGDGKEGWTLWDERAFVETLANQRLYFFLVFMGLIIAGSMTSQPKCMKLTILIFGGIVSGFFVTTISRSFRTIDHILTHLTNYNTDNEVVGHWAAMKSDSRFDRCIMPTDHNAYLSNALLGQWIPWICMACLLVLAVTVLFA
jgi:hypothetical protein